MRTGHLSEEEIQQYALDASSSDADIIGHIGNCGACKTKVTNYRSLFAAMQEQPRPVFEFDVAGQVLSQFQGKTKEVTQTDWSLYLIISGVFSLLGVPLYYLKKEIVIMLTGMLPVTISLVTISGTLVLVFQGIDLVKKYKQRSDALNH